MDSLEERVEEVSEEAGRLGTAGPGLQEENFKKGLLDTDATRTHRTVREVRPLTTSLDGVDGWSQATGTVDRELLFKKHFPCTETHKVCVLKIFIWYLH